MLPRLPETPAPASLYGDVLTELRLRGFEGDLAPGYGDRLVSSTDNSIYQLLPQAIAFPRTTDDLVRIARVAAESRFAGLVLAPRGGGTGTNGQSLTGGLVVDVSRHMTRVLEIDPAAGWVRVQAGVVKDQLNAALAEHGLFFAPELSTSNRATIGGMVSTDACGQGSCLYGKTRDHVLELTTVLLDGTVWTSRPLEADELARVQRRTDRVGAVHRLVDAIQREQAGSIERHFPKLNRCLTGYDLAHIRDARGRFDLNAILCGSEGTLGLLAEAKLRVLPIPKCSALVNIRYDSFDAALRDARALMAVQAASVETVDSEVLALARDDVVWHDVRDWFPDDPEGPAAGVNLVELLADDEAALDAQLRRVEAKLAAEGRAGGRRGYTVARDAAPGPARRAVPSPQAIHREAIRPEGRSEGSDVAEGRQGGPGGRGGAESADGAAIQGGVRLAEDGDETEGHGVHLPPAAEAKPVERIWGMRKKAVGLLGNRPGGRRPIPFVEDTAVPPEHLADYIAEFRAALDRRGLAYGMFGHVDAGVLHVRPAIDMTDPAQEPLIREISDEIAALTRKYGGVLWGEHGKGVRSEYAPDFFGPLYPCLQQIKAAFDPHGQLNPGKIAAPEGGALLRIDGVPTRGARDRAIPAAIREASDGALHCNGNGACYTWDPDEAMCPSYKATRDRRHSPKGRASLTREWLRQLAAAGFDPVQEAAALRRAPAWRSFPARVRNTLARRRGEADFSHEVKDAMDGCLACKSCTGQCPIKVDVPTFRAKFLELYYGRHLRPMRDHLVGSLETLLPAIGRMRGLYNLALGSPPGRAATRAVGLVHTPKLSRVSMRRELAARGIEDATPRALAALPAGARARSVVLVQDAFTSWYETEVVLDVLDLVQTLGFRPWIAPFRPNGKPLHVHGFLGRFGRVAARNAAMLRALAETGVELVGVDPSMTLTYRSEYMALPEKDRPPRVLLVQEWLARHLDAIPSGGSGAGPGADPGGEFLLLPHCTERALAPSGLSDWRAAFAAAGAGLRVLPSGCCGMAGTYGHEAEHRATSERIYALSWAAPVAAHAGGGRLLATGYSCRAQAKLAGGAALPHPARALLGCLRPRR